MPPIVGLDIVEKRESVAPARNKIPKHGISICLFEIISVVHLSCPLGVVTRVRS
jgi:hypothetical protein